MMKFNAHQKNLELIVDIDNNVECNIWVDEIRLKQIIQNLLSNAIKFTHKGEIIIKVTLLEKTTDKSILNFEIIDTGVGIKPENQSKVLEAFTQEDSSTTRNYGGTGLGLSITNSLLKMMNSKLVIESEVNKGSKFSFALELKSKPCERLTKLTNNKIDNVLIVEDNNYISALIRKTFKNFGIESESTPEIRNINFENFKLVLLDFEYLGSNSVTEIIQTHPKVQFLIMQNSTSVFKEIDNYKNANAIVKPLKIEVLQNYLNKLNNPDEKEVKTSKTIEKITKENFKVLIVEDNKINLLLTKTLLTKKFSNVSIFEAENGLEAVQNYKIYKPDIVLMDIQMPVMNGYEATKEIRKLNPNAIIIALTAGVIAGEKDKCMDIGMNDFILKPIDKNIFDETIFKWVNTL